MENNSKQRFIAAIVDKFEIEESDIVPEGVIREVLDIDSLGIVDLLIIVEEVFGLRLRSENLANIITFRDMFDVIDNNHD